MKINFLGRSKVDVDDPEKYSILDPIWKILENTPNQGTTWDKLAEETHIEDKILIPMIQEIAKIFMTKMSKILLMGNIMNIDPEKFWDENLKTSWLFDKIMLMTMKINTGIENEAWENNPYMQAFKEKWLESKGM
jgi:hypothetical protein